MEMKVKMILIKIIFTKKIYCNIVKKLKKINIIILEISPISKAKYIIFLFNYIII